MTTGTAVLTTGVWGAASSKPLIQTSFPMDRVVVDHTLAELQSGNLLSAFIGETYNAGDSTRSQLNVLQ